jgi:hypothetical protein
MGTKSLVYDCDPLCSRLFDAIVRWVLDHVFGEKDLMHGTGVSANPCICEAQLHDWAR